ncbi:tol-pal system-associated acyl-CoA thioesterase [soil metagenome]
MNEAKLGFNWPVRVYYEDTDAGGVVYYANYLKFFERARTEWLRAIGINQLSLAQSHNVMFVASSTAVDYHAPARLDDELKVSVVVERLGRASLQLVQQAWRVDQGSLSLLTGGRIRIGCVDATSFRACAIPDDILARISTINEPMAIPNTINQNKS